MLFSLRFDDNGTLHDDLVLTIGDESVVCDSYYLAIDQILMPTRRDAQKTRLVLVQLLNQWLSAISTLADQGTAYLPYDFSDEYSGWIECRRVGDDVLVARGMAEVQGWSFIPSAPGNLSIRPKDLQIETLPVRIERNELCQAILNSSRDAAAS